jgi:FkbM family methyltransferase
LNILTKLKLRLHKHFGWEFFARSAYGFDIVALYDFTGKISLNGSHSKIIENVVKELSPEDCFIDIGANAGIFSLIASRQVGSKGIVISFEPNPEVFRILQKNLIQNKSTNVLPFCAGVGEKDELLSFVFDPEHNGLGHLKANEDYNWDRANQKETRVLVMGHESLSFLKTATHERKKTIIKIDTEGAEFLVLKGLENHLEEIAPYKLIVELSNEHLARFGHNIEQVYSLMKKHGYKGTVNELKSNDFDHYDEVFIKS